jgi:hypothetical protein
VLIQIDLNIFLEYFPHIILGSLFLIMTTVLISGIKSLREYGQDIIEPGTFQKLGMIGTMIGLVYVFYEFDISNISTMIQGTAYAIFSTLIGLVFDQIYLWRKRKYTDTITSDDTNGLIQKIVDQISQIQSKIPEINSSELLLEEIKLGRTESNNNLLSIKNEMVNFTQKLAKNNTEALIEAVKNVMRDFNSKINDNLGDTFKQLNSSVENLVKWQSDYKDYLDNYDKNLRMALNSIKSSDETLENISHNLISLPESVNSLGELIKQIGVITDYQKQHVNELDDRLIAFSEMKDKAINAFPLIQNNLENITTRLDSDMTNVSNSIKESSDRLTNVSEKQIKHLNDIAENMDTNISNSISTMNQNITKVNEKISENIDIQYKDLNSHLKISMEDNANALNASSKMHQEHISQICGVVKDKIDQSTKGLDEAVLVHMKKIGNSISAQEDWINKIVMTIDTNIKKSTNNINEVVEEQIKALSKSTKEMIRETNDSFISIMEKLDGNFENLDKQMQHEITKALQILVNKMTGFNSEFVKVHGDMIRTISSSTNDLIERRRQ